eukprot:TRINITY_DN12248_c0_g1_i4.p1 TRINITY_DN12248_c0_g1~~TRINITY_DN12248_c0_g1_i4.p1  ORF type:complete len:318 (-),score=-11.44 TRINITY_DN12248_c0_g1_i4:486-1439(-)
MCIKTISVEENSFMLPNPILLHLQQDENESCSASGCITRPMCKRLTYTGTTTLIRWLCLLPRQPGSTTDLILTDMPEKSYTFSVRTVDKYGHTSLTMTDFGTSYGDIFQSSLAHRRIRDVSITDKGGEITWFAAAENLAGNQIRYDTNNGTEAVVWMPASTNIVLCPDAKTSSTFEYRSLFIPEEEAIDTFVIGWTPYETMFPAIYQYDKSAWAIVSYSDQEASDGGGVSSLIDGKLNNWWHSQYDNGKAPLPHWVIIDLASSKKDLQDRHLAPPWQYRCENSAVLCQRQPGPGCFRLGENSRRCFRLRRSADHRLA